MVVGLVAIALRWSFVEFVSGDFTAFLSRWWAYIDQHGHLAAMKDGSFSNYNTPYLVLLALATYLPVRAIVAVKAISVAFGVLLAVTASRLVAAVRPHSSWLPLVTFAVVSLLPTVVMNSGVWAVRLDLRDVLYGGSAVSGTGPALGSLRLVRPGVRVQAAGDLPASGPRGRPAREPVAPAVVDRGASDVPRLPAPRADRGPEPHEPARRVPRSDQRSLRGGRCRRWWGPAGARPAGGPAGGPGGPGGGLPPGASTTTQGATLTHNAPTPYAWLSSSSVWLYAGLALVALVVLVAATSTLLIPLLLPQMHERYFYLAEVFLVVAAMVDRRFVVAALGIQVESISTYLGYLRDQPLMPLTVAAVFALAAGVAATWLLVQVLRASARAEVVS
ncbi:MAG TPA: hypothetical protein VIL68_10310 [Propionibacteriaceae bacterium]